MLPQFGYIVAQAGADSLAPQPPATPPPQNTSSSSLAPLLNNKPFILPYTTQSSSTHYHHYTQRTPSPSVTQQQQNPYLYASPLPQKKNNKKPPIASPFNSGTEDIIMSEEEDDDDDGILNEYNDLMTWMDNEFREQAEKVYHEKLNDLQAELQGTHSAFKEAIEEYELIREKSIADAAYFMKYQLTFFEHVYDKELDNLEEDYENEKKQLIDHLIQSLEEKKKQAKEDEEDAGRTKRSLRKRNIEASSITVKNDTISNKKRAARTNALPNIHTIPAAEEEELEAEFVHLKLLVAKQ